VDDVAAGRGSAPWLLGVAWLPGTAVLCCLSTADTYMGMLDPPLPPTAWTRTILTLYVSWTVLVPLAGLTISLRQGHGRSVRLLHVLWLVGAVWLSYVGVEFVT
jgi:hypothetical protein